MIFPPNSPWRGCASNFDTDDDDKITEMAAQQMVEAVYNFNCREVNQNPLPDIIYRSSDGNKDIRYHVFRWDTMPFQQAFRNGFRARSETDPESKDTPDNIYYDLNHYVHHSGRPLDASRQTNHPFISTTINSSWKPAMFLQPGETMQIYRYEIYAPGGIWVSETLGDLYQFPSQDEVCFVAGIARQFIRSAQLFTVTGQEGTRHSRYARADTTLNVNRCFNPQPGERLNIQMPVSYYKSGTKRIPLDIIYYDPRLNETDNIREKREVSSDDDTINWYTVEVTHTSSYINAAIRSSRENEVFLFMKNEYVCLNYAPGTTEDRIVNGPLLICDGFPSLIGTVFGEHGIECAFDTYNENKAFIFSSNLCAYIDYAPGTTNDVIENGPMKIASMFPFFKDTPFENGIDTAFNSSVEAEAYLFKGDQYALINYDKKSLIAISKITNGFYSLRDTIFADGIDAAFASHKKNEAYIFKGNQYALINFAPGTTDDYIIGGPKEILPNWPSLQHVLPCNNEGLDIYEHPDHPQADRDQDAL